MNQIQKSCLPIPVWGGNEFQTFALRVGKVYGVSIDAE